MFKTHLFAFLAGALGSWFWFRFQIETKVELVFAKFRDEVHNQYLNFLDQHGVKLTKEARAELEAWRMQ